jgi:glycerol-3-phosphate O-acyltransferase
MTFFEQLNRLYEANIIPSNYKDLLINLYRCYSKATEDLNDTQFQEQLFKTLLTLVKQQCHYPFTFAPYHKCIKEPYDYQKFGLDFTRPLLHKDSSSIINEDRLAIIKEQLKKGENVVLLANHQTELDPQIILCLLEDRYFDIASQMIFVAGHKVITDLLAIPFSMGCNLLCIYSKRHINHDAELKLQKQLHNQRTMKLMSSLFKAGGKFIYVAPSGGRDRANKDGIVEVAAFDPDSIEMFRLMALQSKTPTHFYPLALSTYDVLPPPSTIEKDVAEKRITTKSSVHISFGEECDMELKDLTPSVSKHDKRVYLAKRIQNNVEKDYEYLIKLKEPK